ncbi:MAG TPA: hypothetical protein VII06_40490 [Chloroflexota bacterium]
MKDITNYDGDLQMFRERSPQVNLAQLRFVRWLVEHGRLEHLPAGPSSGPFVEEEGYVEAAALEAAA